MPTPPGGGHAQSETACTTRRRAGWAAQHTGCRRAGALVLGSLGDRWLLRCVWPWVMPLGTGATTPGRRAGRRRRGGRSRAGRVHHHAVARQREHLRNTVDQVEHRLLGAPGVLELPPRRGFAAAVELPMMCRASGRFRVAKPGGPLRVAHPDLASTSSLRERRGQLTRGVLNSRPEQPEAERITCGSACRVAHPGRVRTSWSMKSMSPSSSLYRRHARGSPRRSPSRA